MDNQTEQTSPNNGPLTANFCCAVNIPRGTKGA